MAAADSRHLLGPELKNYTLFLGLNYTLILGYIFVLSKNIVR